VLKSKVKVSWLEHDETSFYTKKSRNYETNNVTCCISTFVVTFVWHVILNTCYYTQMQTYINISAKYKRAKRSSKRV